MRLSSSDTAPHAGALWPLLLLAISCSAFGFDPAASKRAELSHRRAVWESHQLTDYRFVYARSCFCVAESEQLMVEVHDDRVTAARPIHEDQPVPVSTLAGIPTVDDLFDLIERALVRHADALEVGYHPELGYPTMVAIDWEFGVADDEVGHSVTNLHALGGG